MGGGVVEVGLDISSIREKSDSGHYSICLLYLSLHCGCTFNFKPKGFFLYPPIQTIQTCELEKKKVRTKMFDHFQIHKAEV